MYIFSVVQKFEWGDAEETVPVRVDQAGYRIHPAEQQFLSFDSSGQNSGSLYYNVNAFGKILNLELTQDRSTVSPRLNVEYIFSDVQKLQLPGDLGYCLYKARVRNSSSSSGIFNVCNGIVSQDLK